MSDYEVVSRGALKLKGVSVSGIKRKKKKKTKNELELKVNVNKVLEGEVKEGSGVSSLDSGVQKKRTARRRRQSSSSSSWDLDGSNAERQTENKESDCGSTLVRKTTSQLAFEKMQEKRQMQKILEKASKTHKQRVEEFNRHLDSLTEHYDIPKVSWTK